MMDLPNDFPLFLFPFTCDLLKVHAMATNIYVPDEMASTQGKHLSVIFKTQAPKTSQCVIQATPISCANMWKLFVCIRRGFTIRFVIQRVSFTVHSFELSHYQSVCPEKAIRGVNESSMLHFVVIYVADKPCRLRLREYWLLSAVCCVLVPLQGGAHLE